MTTEYSFHEAANLFPMMEEEAHAGLCKDIAANGLLEPIWLHEGKILDGRNRYKACKETGTTPTFREWDGEGGAVTFACSLNLNRRHLSPSQKAVVAAQLEPLIAQESKKRQIRKPAATDSVMAKMPEQNEPHKTSREVAAALTGASPRNVQHVKAIAKIAPEKVQEIQEGKTTISKVLKEIKPEPGKPVRKKVESEVADPATILAAQYGVSVLNIKRDGAIAALLDLYPEKALAVLGGELSTAEAVREIWPRVEKPLPSQTPQRTDAISFAESAISLLNQINNDDPDRVPALVLVQEWITSRLSGGFDPNGDIEAQVLQHMQTGQGAATRIVKGLFGGDGNLAVDKLKTFNSWIGNTADKTTLKLLSSQIRAGATYRSDCSRTQE
jgi:hypothetical protein